MRYQISGMHIDIGQALQTHVKTNLVMRSSNTPSDRLTQMSYSQKVGTNTCVKQRYHLSTGLTAQAKASNPEIYSAFDSCCEKMEKQLRRYKRRLKDHQKNAQTQLNSWKLPRISLP